MAQTLLQAAQALYPEKGFNENTTREDIFAAVINTDEFIAAWPNIVESLKASEAGQRLAAKAVAAGMTQREFKDGLLMMGFSAYMQAKLMMLRDAVQGK